MAFLNSTNEMKQSNEQNSKSLDLAIVLPTLNEEEGVKITINSIKKALEGKLNYKIIVVDGLSKDKTVDIAKSLGAIVLRQRRKGTGDALQAGFYYAKNNLNSSLIAMMDADATYDPRDLLKMVEVIEKGDADFVTGNRLSKMDRGAMTGTNKFGNRILSAVARQLLNIDIADSQSGIRVFKSDLASLFYSVNTGFPFVTEMLVTVNQYNLRIKEIPVLYHSRKGETNLNPLKDGSRILSTIIRLMRDFRPLAFFGIIGIIICIVGLVFGIEVLIEYFETGLVSRIPSAILSSLLLLVGVQTIVLGLLSDMIKSRTIEKRTFYSEYS